MKSTIFVCLYCLLATSWLFWAQAQQTTGSKTSVVVSEELIQLAKQRNLKRAKAVFAGLTVVEKRAAVERIADELKWQYPKSGNGSGAIFYPVYLLDLVRVLGPEARAAAPKVAAAVCTNQKLYFGYNKGPFEPVSQRQDAAKTLAVIDPGLKRSQPIFERLMAEREDAINPELVDLLFSQPPRVRRRFAGVFERIRTTPEPFVQVAIRKNLLRLAIEVNSAAGIQENAWALRRAVQTGPNDRVRVDALSAIAELQQGAVRAGLGPLGFPGLLQHPVLQ